MITLKRKSGVSLQAGVDSYVFLFWKQHRNCQAIVSIETSYDGELWSKFNAIAFPLMEADGCVRVGWLNDILDGEDYVRILGIQDIQSIEVGMKSNNKRPLISCIAFVCKNTESVKRTIKHLENEYGFDLIWSEGRRWRLESANGQFVEIWTYGLFSTMRAHRYDIVFVEECIYAKMYEKACCQTWRIDSIVSSIIPVPFRFDNSSRDNVLNFDKE